TPGRNRLPGDGVRRRRIAGGLSGEGPVTYGASAAIWQRDRGRAGQGASQRGGPSRHQARQYYGDEERNEAAGFRSGETETGSGSGASGDLPASDAGSKPDGGGDDSGYAAVHGARAGGRQDRPDRRQGGYFRVWRCGLRDGHGQESIRG